MVLGTTWLLHAEVAFSNSHLIVNTTIYGFRNYSCYKQYEVALVTVIRYCSTYCSCPKLQSRH